MENFNNIACCLAMYHDLLDGYFIYDSVFNCVRYTTIGMNPADKQIIAYCPHCGEKLPFYFNEFNEELGKLIKNGDDELPKEFQSDEWWKKRNIKGLGTYWKMYSPIKLSERNDIRI